MGFFDVGGGISSAASKGTTTKGNTSFKDNLNSIKSFNIDLSNLNLGGTPNINNNDLSNVETIDFSAEIASEPDLTQVRVPVNDWVFDPRNSSVIQFGGNQGELFYNKEKWLSDPFVEAIIEKYYGKITQEEKEMLFFRMDKVGCGYMAAINTLMNEYIFHDELDFRARFGFNPYTLIRNDDGQLVKDFNYEYLFLDFALYYQQNYNNFNTIDEVLGNVAEEMQVTTSGDGALTDTSDNFVRVGLDGTYLNSVSETMKAYLSDKGIILDNTSTNKAPPGTKIWQKIIDSIDNEAYKKYLIDSNAELNIPSGYMSEFVDYIQNNQGGALTVSADKFTLYYPEDMDGNGLLDDIYATDIGSHAMTVVGTTSDPSKIIVSSWGCEFVLDVDAINDYQVYSYGEFSSEFPDLSQGLNNIINGQSNTYGGISYE